MTNFTPATIKQLEALSIDPSAISKPVDAIHSLAKAYAEINRLAFQAINDLDEEGLTSAERSVVRECLEREFRQVNPAAYIAAF